MKLYLKELLIVSYVFKSYDLYIDRLKEFYADSASGFNVFYIPGFSHISFFITASAYLVLFFLLLLALVSSAWIKNNTLRYIYGLLFFISAVFFDTYQKIANNFLSYETFISLLNAGGFASEAIAQYFSIIATAFIYGLLLLLGIVLKPNPSTRCPKWVSISSPPLAIFLLSMILFFKGGSGAQGLPGMYTPLSYLNLLAFEQLYSDNTGKRQSVTFTRNNIAINHDIILIIDESIAANYLDINSPLGVKTNLNQPYNDIAIYNYGYAVSITNCSAETNIVLRYGGTHNNYIKAVSTMPSIWQYAKKAGLDTVYIDSQRTDGQLQNKMTPEELADVDQFIQFNDAPMQQRDYKAVLKLIDLINNDKHELIVINKIGAHFPIHDKYPDEFMRYKPVLARGSFLNISDTGSRAGFEGDSKGWLEYRNSYRNTLLWNVGNFFALLFEKANLNNAVIIYTSDHGQDLHERGNLGTYTHCSSSPNMEEGLVPLVVIEGKKLTTLNWQQALITNKNKSSHYAIFPTLLTLMYYDNAQIKSFYGNALDVKSTDEFSFNTRFNARLGKKPVWEKIDLKKITMPKNSDFE